MTINSAVAKLPACVWFGNSCGCAMLGKMRGAIIAETTPALPRSSWLIVSFDFVYEFQRNSWGIPFVSLQGAHFNKMFCFLQSYSRSLIVISQCLSIFVILHNYTKCVISICASWIAIHFKRRDVTQSCDYNRHDTIHCIAPIVSRRLRRRRRYERDADDQARVFSAEVSASSRIPF